MADAAKNLGRRLLFPFRSRSPLSAHRSSTEEFWALKDVSFAINQGDRIGIIGRNGAGKSTLLKILSRITEPTNGRVTIRGRVASLLEVGTGFHPELTGRENIYLNGAILGMTRAEIKKKFDEIVDFAEVEKFLDTPVKRYSSGMYVRLAFAVAAHLEPEILLVDEVLAVGDAQFQKKCLGKMEDVSRQEGRTVLFVSHNMNAVEQLCTSVIMLDNGVIKDSGDRVSPVIQKYLFGNKAGAKIIEWANLGDQLKNQWMHIRRFSLTDEKGNAHKTVFDNNSEMWVQIEVEIKKYEPGLQIGYAVFTEDDQLLYWTCQCDGKEEEWPSLDKGMRTLRSRIPRRLLNEGTYRIELIAAVYYRAWISEPGNNAPSIFLSIQGNLSDSPYWMVKRPGILAPVLPWKSNE